MRSRALQIALALVVTLLIIVGIVYYQKDKMDAGVQNAQLATPAESSNPLPKSSDGAAGTNGQNPLSASGMPSGNPSASISGSPLPSGSPSPGVSGVMPNASNSPKPADMTTDASGLSNSTAVFNTNKGTFKFKFYAKDAPLTSARIAQLIQSGFYSGIIFHRVEPGFVVQTGDPTGTGAGGSGQKLKAEFNDRRHMEGTVAMARTSDPNSADSQFYITFGTQPRLDHQYTVFGQVIDGMDTIRKITVSDKINSASIQ